MTLWRLRATVDDRPGFLAVLTASLALKSINILAVQVHGTEAGAVDDFLVDAPDDLAEADVLAAVVKGRGRDPWIRRTDARHLVDAPTEALGAAVRLVRDPETLPETLADVLLAVKVQPVAADTPMKPGFSATRMQVVDPRGGMILLERPTPAFTPAEYARARALVNVARAALGLPGPAHAHRRHPTGDDEIDGADDGTPVRAWQAPDGWSDFGGHRADDHGDESVRPVTAPPSVPFTEPASSEYGS